MMNNKNNDNQGNRDRESCSELDAGVVHLDLWKSHLEDCPGLEGMPVDEQVGLFAILKEYTDLGEAA